jgi:hypothetical protein
MDEPRAVLLGLEKIQASLLQPSLENLLEAEESLVRVAEQLALVRFDRAQIGQILGLTGCIGALLHQAGASHRNWAEALLSAAGGYSINGCPAALPSVHQMAVEG